MYSLKTNLVCLAEGAKPADLRPFGDFFSAFTFLVIAVPDEARREALEEGLRAALPQCGIVSVKPEEFKGCGSLGGCAAMYGTRDKLLMQVRELPAYGLLDISEVLSLPPGVRPAAATGIPELDRSVGGAIIPYSIASGLTALSTATPHSCRHGWQARLFDGHLRPGDNGSLPLRAESFGNGLLRHSAGEIHALR